MMRFNLGAPDDATRRRAFATMLELVEFADAARVAEVSFSEHHATASGSLTSPLVVAAAALARSSRIQVSVAAMLLPLYDPTRVAEDLALLDNAFPGRLRVTAAMGYRPEEYELYGRAFAERAKLMDEALATIRHVWSESAGPAPVTPVAQLLAVGGQTPLAARRAARFGLAFAPRAFLPDLGEIYETAARAAGDQPVCWMPAPTFLQVHVSADPGAAWSRIGSAYFADAAEYAGWQRGTVQSSVFSDADDLEAFRRSGALQVVTPAECLALVRDPAATTLSIHPLAGGLADADAWECVRLFADTVLPALEERSQ